MTAATVVATVAAKLDAALTVTVFDGTTSGQDANYQTAWVGIGNPWDDDQQAVVTDRAETGAAGRQRLDYQIACIAYAGDGGDDISVPRGIAAQLVADVDAALQADRTLGGAVARARVGEVDRQDEGRDAQGVGVRIGFTIDATTLP